MSDNEYTNVHECCELFAALCVSDRHDSKSRHTLPCERCEGERIRARYARRGLLRNDDSSSQCVALSLTYLGASNLPMCVQFRVCLCRFQTNVHYDVVFDFNTVTRATLLCCVCCGMGHDRFAFYDCERLSLSTARSCGIVYRVSLSLSET